MLLVLLFATLEPFAVTDGVYKTNQDEEESYLSVDYADWGVTVNQPLWNGGEYCHCQYSDEVYGYPEIEFQAEDGFAVDASSMIEVASTAWVIASSEICTF